MEQVSLKVQFNFVDGELSHYIFESESSKHKCRGPSPWSDGYVIEHVMTSLGCSGLYHCSRFCMSVLQVGSSKIGI